MFVFAVSDHISFESCLSISYIDINDLLIPVIEMVRGTTYTFIVNGGDDPTSSSEYHPFYLTDVSQSNAVMALLKNTAVSNSSFLLSFYRVLMEGMLSALPKSVHRKLFLAALLS